MFDKNLNIVLPSLKTKKNKKKKFDYAEKSIISEQCKYVYFIAKEYVDNPTDELKFKFIQNFEKLMKISKESLNERINDMYEISTKLKRKKIILDFFSFKEDLKDVNNYIKYIDKVRNVYIHEIENFNYIRALYDIEKDTESAIKYYIKIYSFMYDIYWISFKKNKH